MASREFQQRQTQRDLIANAIGLLSGDAIGARFDELTQLADPTIQSLINEAGVIGQAQAGSARANLRRQGFEGTFAEDIGSGFQAGAAFRGQALRSRILQDLMRQSVGIQGQLAQGVFANAGGVFAQGGGEGFEKQMVANALDVGGAIAASRGGGGGGGGGTQ